VTKTRVTGGEKLPASLITCVRTAVGSARFTTTEKVSLTVPVSFRSVPQPPPFNFVLTRLHARYDKESLGEDLVFREAPPILGGREVRDGKGKLETGANTQDRGRNNFQGRYAIRHPWTGEIKCKNPVRGVWGGPPQARRAAAWSLRSTSRSRPAASRSSRASSSTTCPSSS
jgi:hypothetical protein